MINISLLGKLYQYFYYVESAEGCLHAKEKRRNDKELARFHHNYCYYYYINFSRFHAPSTYQSEYSCLKYSHKCER